VGSSYPIDEILPAVRAALDATGRLVIEAPPGAGKSTRVPPVLRDALGGKVVICQPRRLAARSVAARVAELEQSRIGDAVGYRVRFDRKVSARTTLEFVTTGLLLRQVAAGDQLDGVAAVVLDEFHERSLDSDLLIGLMKRLQAGPRPELVLVVMSATLDREAVMEYLPDAQVLTSEGRRFPVATHYHAGAGDLQAVACGAIKIALEQSDGHVLVFLPGQGAIHRVRRTLGERGDYGCEVRPLYGSLPVAEQQAAIAPGGNRRIILSTNIAETSLTVAGVTAVIDSGLVRKQRFDPWSGIARLVEERNSQASAEQRRGRAGRLGPGLCIRLYGELEFHARPEKDDPEIASADLAEALLVLHGAGITSASDFDWISPPTPTALTKATHTLTSLGALDDGALTARGRLLARLPLHPRLGRLALEAHRLGVGRDGALLAALLSEGARLPFRDGPRVSSSSDALVLLDGAARRPGPAKRIAGDIARALKGQPIVPAPGDADAALGRAILAAYHDHVAARRSPGSDQLKLAAGGALRQAPASTVRDALFVVVLDADGKADGNGSARLLSAIDPEWLIDQCADRLDEIDELVWDSKKERVRRLSELRFGALEVHRHETAPTAGDEVAVAELLAAQALRVGADRFVTGGRLQTLRLRLALLAGAGGRTDEGLQDDVNQDAGIESSLPEAQLHRVLARACRGLTSFAELQSAALWDRIQASLPVETRRALNRDVPTEITLVGGTTLPVQYNEHGEPFVASYIQDFFGSTVTPSLLGGRHPLALHLWAPNRRSVQITRDLPGFWERHYGTIRKELKRRYPKHTWPEDPGVPQPRLKSRAKKDGQTSTPKRPLRR
jgi:ATP-dependent helicase HrpB